MSEKTLIMVSSITGNTLMVAQAIHSAYPNSTLMSTEDALKHPSAIESAQHILIGFWCDKGGLPPALAETLPHIHDKTLGIFCTMGGDPESERARAWFERECSVIVGADRNNVLKETFLCQGKIDPALIEKMKQLPGYKETPETRARRERASTHPDERDLQDAVRTFASFFEATLHG
jgi:flavodoxin